MSIQTSNFVDINENCYSTIMITGACRSGKTLLGNILATYQQVEYADEPYAPMMLPKVVASGKIDEILAISWMSNLLSELFNDLVLLRAANFRSNDLSSIWTKKTPDEIHKRLHQINSREEVAHFSKQNGSKFIITLTECDPFIDFIIKAVPNIKIIQVIRNPYQVAVDVAKKMWFSDAQLLKPKMAQLYDPYFYKNKTWYLPWWVNNEDYGYFIDLSVFERSLYYWWSLMEKSLSFHQSGYIQELIRYEDLINYPEKILDYLASKLQLTKTSLTGVAIDNIQKNKAKKVCQNLNNVIRDRVIKVEEELNGNGNFRYQ